MLGVKLSDHMSLEQAISATGESAALDFKTEYDPSQPREKLELLKDIVAMANYGGGIILIGAKDDGSPSGVDVSKALAIDPADVGNLIHKYTGQNFSDVLFQAVSKGTYVLCALTIGESRVPIAFSRVGECELADNKKKTVFALGTVYFRHGAKSEPGTSEDFRAFLERELEKIRASWLEGIVKIVEAPAGSRVVILPPASAPEGAGGALPMRLTDDSNATPYYAVPIDSTHPYRQKEVINELNSKLVGKQINAHDILCIRRVYEVQKDLKFCYTQNFTSPRYSEAFVDWIIKNHEQNNNFFENAKHEYAKIKAKNSSA
jgi:hypothetical protein